MKHLKHINEMENWATPNRLGFYDKTGGDNVKQFVEEYPGTINHGHISAGELNKVVVELANRLNLSVYDLDEILQKKLIFNEYLVKAFDIYREKYLK